MIQTIDSAHSSIRMAAYTFTSKPIAQALVEARSRVVVVRLVVDRRQNYRGYTVAHFVANHGIEVLGDSRCAINHDKFIVVDNDVVEEDSFNYTAAAERKNAAYDLVLRDRTVAQEYVHEFTCKMPALIST